MVPESFSADEAVCVQRGRIPDAEFYSDAGHDDFGIDCRAMVARGGAEDSVSKVAAGGSCRNRCGIAAACGGGLPGGYAVLGARVGIVLRGELFFVVGG